MDLLNICRLCMAEKLELFNVFEESESLNCNPGTSFADIVAEITQVNIYVDDPLSKNICGTCKDSCNDFVKFREMIISSNDYQQMLFKSETTIEEMGTVVIEQIVAEEMQIVEEDDKPVDEQYALSVDIRDLPDNSTISNDEQFLFSDELTEEIESSGLITSASSDDESDADATDSPIYSCTSCSMTFNKPRKLQEHLKSHSTKVRLYPCKTCKRKFTTEILLTRHEIIHSDLITQIKSEVKHRCLICNLTLRDKNELEDHMREHKAKLDMETINCQYCNKAYTKLSNLIRHLKTHDDNKTHLCNVCHKTFAMGQDLIDHLNRHKGFTPHACNICNKSYMQISKLRNHQRSHSEDKVRRSDFPFISELISTFVLGIFMHGVRQKLQPKQQPPPAHSASQRCEALPVWSMSRKVCVERKSQSSHVGPHQQKTLRLQHLRIIVHSILLAGQT